MVMLVVFTFYLGKNKKFLIMWFPTIIISSKISYLESLRGGLQNSCNLIFKVKHILEILEDGKPGSTFTIYLMFKPAVLIPAKLCLWNRSVDTDSFPLTAL